MDDAAALKRLKLLLKEEGALKIVSHFHACQPDDVRLTDQHIMDAIVAEANGAPPSAAVARCEAYANKHDHAKGMPGGYPSVGHYRLHDVKRLEEGDKEGKYVAYADDELGTQTSGSPSALLRSLTEHENAS